MKICCTCKISLDESCFNKSVDKKDGLMTKCKACCRAYQEARYVPIPPIDLTNQRFGRLVAISREPAKRLPNGKFRNDRWLCHCDCGGKITSGMQSLKTGVTQSCGCLRKELSHNRMKKEIKIGSKFNKLTVVKEVEQAKTGRCRYLCSCECGEITVVDSSNLGMTKSCGCAAKEHVNALNKQRRIEAGFDPDVLMSTKRRLERDETYKYRKLAYIRDRFRCVLCCSTYKLNAHHIKPFAECAESRNDITNFITLCKSCHKSAHLKHYTQVDPQVARLLTHIINHTYELNNNNHLIQLPQESILSEAVLVK